MEEAQQDDFPNSGTGRPAVTRVTSDFWAMVSHYEEFIPARFSVPCPTSEHGATKGFPAELRVCPQPHAAAQGGRRRRGKEYLKPEFSLSALCHETTSRCINFQILTLGT